MPKYTKICEDCGRYFIATRRNQKFCSGACRKHHFNRVHKKQYSGLVMEPDGIKEPNIKPVMKDEVAQAIVNVRAAIGTLSAAELMGPPSLRPCCGRLKVSLLQALEAEGL